MPTHADHTGRVTGETVEERLRRRRADRLAEAEAAALEAKGLARSQAMLAKIKVGQKN